MGLPRAFGVRFVVAKYYGSLAHPTALGPCCCSLRLVGGRRLRLGSGWRLFDIFDGLLLLAFLDLPSLSPAFALACGVFVFPPTHCVSLVRECSDWGLAYGGPVRFCEILWIFGTPNRAWPMLPGATGALVEMLPCTIVLTSNNQVRALGPQSEHSLTRETQKGGRDTQRQWSSMAPHPHKCKCNATRAIAIPCGQQQQPHREKSNEQKKGEDNPPNPRA